MVWSITIAFHMQDIYNYITTPIFVLNSLYDSSIFEFLIQKSCTTSACVEESGIFEVYKEEFARQAQPVLTSPSQNGYFLDSCVIHCQTNVDDRTWSEIAINGRSIAQSFGDWYFERSAVRLKDCDTDLPCNPTCPELDGAVKNIVSPLLFLSLYMMAAFAY